MVPLIGSTRVAESEQESVGNAPKALPLRLSPFFVFVFLAVFAFFFGCVSDPLRGYVSVLTTQAREAAKRRQEVPHAPP